MLIEGTDVRGAGLSSQKIRMLGVLGYAHRRYGC
jgi:hypothetical protein